MSVLGATEANTGGFELILNGSFTSTNVTCHRFKRQIHVLLWNFLLHASYLNFVARWVQNALKQIVNTVEFDRDESTLWFVGICKKIENKIKVVKAEVAPRLKTKNSNYSGHDEAININKDARPSLALFISMTKGKTKHIDRPRTQNAVLWSFLSHLFHNQP